MFDTPLPRCIINRKTPLALLLSPLGFQSPNSTHPLLQSPCPPRGPNHPPLPSLVHGRFRCLETGTGDGTIRSIARHCPGLTSLSTVELTRTSDRSLRELGRRCPLLRLLDCSSDINVLETSHRTRVPKLGGDGVREVS